MPGLISGIQMDADTDQHCPKREMILSPDLQMLQAVIIDNPVVYPFTGSTLAVGFFIQGGIPGNIPFHRGRNQSGRISTGSDIYAPV